MALSQMPIAVLVLTLGTVLQTPSWDIPLIFYREDNMYTQLELTK